jgi:mono/diheme cytochrome c family protein
MRFRTAVAALAAVALAACGGDAAEEGAAFEEVPEPVVEEPVAEEPVGGAMGQAPEGATPEMVTEGQQIFTGVGNCYTCHGPDGTGTTLAPDLTDDEWINIDGTYAAIQEVVRTGVPQPVQHPAPMAAMGGAQLSDQQVQAVSAYVYSLSHGG